MKQALGTTNGNNFSCSASPLGKRSGYDRPENGWACVGKLAQALLDPAQNPVGLKIQTAVVGFGSSFGAGGAETDDVKDAKDWGLLEMVAGLQVQALRMYPTVLISLLKI